MRPRRLTSNRLTPPPPVDLEAQPFRKESPAKRLDRETAKGQAQELGSYFRDRTRSNKVHSQCEEHEVPVRLRDYEVIVAEKCLKLVRLRIF